MKIFITGATGFLGSKIIEQFQDKYSLSILVRNKDLLSKLKEKNITSHYGDLSTIQTEMLNEIDTVIHTAALARPYGKWEDFYHSNVEGTKNLLEKSIAANVKKFIYISTEAVCFQGKDLIEIDERINVLQYQKYDYAYSKMLAEKAVIEAGSDNFLTISLRPSWIWGPGDTNALPMMIDMVKQNKFMWVDQGKARKTTTYIYNLIDAIEASLHLLETRKIYFINDGEYRSLKNFLTPLLATQGVSIPEKSVPGWLIRTVGKIAELSWRLGGRKGRPAGTRLEADFMSSEILIKNDLARQELNWKPRFSIDEGILEVGKI